MNFILCKNFIRFRYFPFPTIDTVRQCLSISKRNTERERERHTQRETEWKWGTERDEESDRETEREWENQRERENHRKTQGKRTEKFCIGI